MAGPIRKLVDGGRRKIPKEQLAEITQKTDKAWESAINKKNEDKKWSGTQIVFANRRDSNASGSITRFYRGHKG